MKVCVVYLLLFILSFHHASLCYGQSENKGKILKGRVEKFQFKESKIFPCTVREVTVYIPGQIEPLVSACIYVQQDGFPNNKKVSGICIGGANFDTLFAFCEDKVYKRKIKNHTVGAFTPWMRMVPGQLWFLFKYVAKNTFFSK